MREFASVTLTTFAANRTSGPTSCATSRWTVQKPKKLAAGPKAAEETGGDRRATGGCVTTASIACARPGHAGHAARRSRARSLSGTSSGASWRRGACCGRRSRAKTHADRRDSRGVPMGRRKRGTLVQEVRCKTEHEFLDAISPRSKHFDEGEPYRVLFRGHADARYRLLPSAYRAKWEKPPTNEEQVRYELEAIQNFFLAGRSMWPAAARRLPGSSPRPFLRRRQLSLPFP